MSRIYAFISFLPNEEEVEEDKHFAYAYQIHILNIFHSTCFVILGWMLLRMASNTNLVFKKEHYKCILNCILAAALLYLLPLFGIIGLSWYHGDDASYESSDSSKGETGPNAMTLLISWIIQTIISDKAGIPLVYSMLIHLELMILLTALWFIS